MTSWKISPLITALCLLLSNDLMAQACSAANIHLTSQAQVDGFQSTYGPCTGVTGELRINGADITGLTPLAGLSVVGEDLLLLTNTTLVSASGLENIGSLAARLVFQDNPLLTDLGVTGLMSVAVNCR